MIVSQVVAIWGAALSTGLALYQIGVRLYDRPRLVVSGSTFTRPLRDNAAEGATGTPIKVTRGHDVLLEEMLVEITVGNRGRRAIQIAAVGIEHLTLSTLILVQVVPEPLPLVLDPLTAQTILLQKEFIDDARQLTFLGIIDVFGRRYSLDKLTCVRIAQTCWNAPSRRQVYQRKDDPTKKVIAFQSMMKYSTIAKSNVARTSKRPRVLAAAPPDLLQDADRPSGQDTAPAD